MNFGENSCFLMVKLFFQLNIYGLAVDRAFVLYFSTPAEKRGGKTAACRHADHSERQVMR